MKSLLLFIVWVVTWCLVGWCTPGCSASYHLRKAKKKDPSLFDTTTVITRTQIELPQVDFEFECPQLGTAPITLYSPIIDTVDGIIYRDSVRIVLQAVDSSIIRAEVDCPDPEIITKVQTNTVYIEPSFWEKVKAGAMIAIILLIIFIAIRIITPYIR